MDDDDDDEEEEVIMVLVFCTVVRGPRNNVASVEGKVTKVLPPIGTQSRKEWVAFWDGIGRIKEV